MVGDANGASRDQRGGDDHAEEPSPAKNAAEASDDESVDEEQLEEYQEMLDSLGVHPVSLHCTVDAHYLSGRAVRGCRRRIMSFIYLTIQRFSTVVYFGIRCALNTTKI